MKKIKSFDEMYGTISQVNVNESNSADSLKYLKSKYKDQRVNSVTFEEVLEPLANHIDDYTGVSMGDLEYSGETIKLFKQLVNAMANDHIKGFSEE